MSTFSNWLINKMPLWVLVACFFYLLIFFSYALLSGKYSISIIPPAINLKEPPPQSNSDAINAKINENEIENMFLLQSAISRGEPIRIGNKFFVAGATTIGKNPKSGQFYILGGEKKEKVRYAYSENEEIDFFVNNKTYTFKATQIEDAWIRAEIRRKK